MQTTDCATSLLFGLPSCWLNYRPCPQKLQALCRVNQRRQSRLWVFVCVCADFSLRQWRRPPAGGPRGRGSDGVAWFCHPQTHRWQARSPRRVCRYFFPMFSEPGEILNAAWYPRVVSQRGGWGVRSGRGGRRGRRESARHTHARGRRGSAHHTHARTRTLGQVRGLSPCHAEGPVSHLCRTRGSALFCPSAVRRPFASPHPLLPLIWVSVRPLRTPCGQRVAPTLSPAPPGLRCGDARSPARSCEQGMRSK